MLICTTLPVEQNFPRISKYSALQTHLKLNITKQNESSELAPLFLTCKKKLTFLECKNYEESHNFRTVHRFRLRRRLQSISGNFEKYPLDKTVFF